jgi:hypothetical protein
MVKEPAMRRSRLALIAALTLISCAALPGQSFTFPGVEFSSARMDALGGMHVALADDISTLFSNPQVFARRGRSLPYQSSR